MSIIFVGDIGTVLLLDCGIDISTATSVKVIAKSPKGIKKEWTAAVDSTTFVKYTTSDGDFDEVGKWSLQAQVTMPDWSGRGAWATVDVKD